MYEAYWKLTTRPFDHAFASDSYYPSDNHQAALLKIRYAIEHRRAAAILTGVSGVGKSMLLQRLVAETSEIAAPCLTLNFTYLSAGEIVRYIALSLPDQQPSEDFTDQARALRAIERFLVDNCKAGRLRVTFIDEAHLLQPTEHLEVLRQLLNLAASHSNGEAAWTVVLSGMPSIISHVQRNGALSDRVSVQCVVPQFTTHDTSAYIVHRLRVAGCEQPGIFHADALDLIHHLTQGVPRKINTLCDLALMVGYAQDAGTIEATLVEAIYSEMNPSAYIGELASR